MNLKLITAIALGVISIHVYADETMPTTTATASQGTVDQAKQTGDAFLKANKAKPGVVTLPDGLQYKIINAGRGPKPGPNDVVTVDYEGKLIDGTVFDSSSQHGGAANFTVNQVIPGWVEALQLMPTGSTWEIYIPSDLAYGERGAPPSIGPNETLIFKVKLINFKKNG